MYLTLGGLFLSATIEYHGEYIIFAEQRCRITFYFEVTHSFVTTKEKPPHQKRFMFVFGNFVIYLPFYCILLFYRGRFAIFEPFLGYSAGVCAVFWKRIISRFSTSPSGSGISNL